MDPLIEEEQVMSDTEYRIFNPVTSRKSDQVIELILNCFYV